ncbi:MAG: Acetyl-CoA:oxalate CoA-transferase [Myxococcota bacterium]|nr:Acetyl-CoA:oxalate CoA-transferase [Myxococcota bacterium]
MGLPLDDVTILDLSRLLPGPYCTQILADLGARVIRVESIPGGDYLRHVPPLLGEWSGQFVSVNRNKESIGLNLKASEGVEVFRALVKKADVVAEGFRPGVMDKLGVGYEQLRQVNPQIILASISGYGQDGPLRERAGHDINYQALAGTLAMLGEPDHPPAFPGVQVADIGGGALFPAIGILSALHGRQRTGKGQWLDFSMTEGAAAFLTMAHGARVETGRFPLRGKERLSGAVPCYAIYGTRDGKAIALGALEPKFWEAFCAAIGRDDLKNDGLLTGEAGERVRREVQAVMNTRARDEWMAILEKADCCAEPVLEGEELINHPQHVHRGLFFDMELDGERYPLMATPIHSLPNKQKPRRDPPPRFGEHTWPVLKWIGYRQADIQRLMESGVVYCAPGFDKEKHPSRP